MFFQLLILTIYSGKTDYNTKINKIKVNITNHDYSNKYITTKKFNKLTPENFAKD